MQFDHSDNVLRLVAQTEEEQGFLRELKHAFFEGSVTIEARNHRPHSNCIECLAGTRYKDCVTASATFNMDSPVGLVKP